MPRRDALRGRVYGRFGGRHCRGEIDQPFGIGGEAAHDFESGHGVFFGDGYVVMEARGDKALSDNIRYIEKVVYACCALSAGGDPDGRVVLKVRSRCGRRDRDEFLFRIRRAVSLPPNTQPVSMLMVRFNHSG